MRHLELWNSLISLVFISMLTVNCPIAAANITSANANTINQNSTTTNNANSSTQSSSTSQGTLQDSSNAASTTNIDDKNQIEKIFKDAKYENFNKTSDVS